MRRGGSALGGVCVLETIVRRNLSPSASTPSYCLTRASALARSATSTSTVAVLLPGELTSREEEMGYAENEACTSSAVVPCTSCSTRTNVDPRAAPIIDKELALGDPLLDNALRLLATSARCPGSPGDPRGPELRAGLAAFDDEGNNSTPELRLDRTGPESGINSLPCPPSRSSSPPDALRVGSIRLPRLPPAEPNRSCVHLSSVFLSCFLSYGLDRSMFDESDSMDACCCC